MKFSRSVKLSIAGLATMAMLAGCGDSAKPTAPGALLDTTPPPAPTNLVLTTDGSGHPALTWTASAAPDVAGYQVHQYSPSPDRDNAYIQVTDSNAADNLFALPSTTVDFSATYRVRAVDAAGNMSPFSSPLDVYVPIAPTGGGGGKRSEVPA